MQQIADQVGVHVTTVSRAVDDKWIQTPRGMFPLKRFFVGGTRSDDGDDVAWDRIRLKLQELVDNEDKQHPYSDDDLVKKLKESGMKVAAPHRDQVPSEDGYPELAAPTRLEQTVAIPAPSNLCASSHSRLRPAGPRATSSHASLTGRRVPLTGPAGPDENRRGPVAPVLCVPHNLRVPAGRMQVTTTSSHASLTGRAFRRNTRARGPPAPVVLHKLTFLCSLVGTISRRVWNRRISSKECRTLKGDTGLLPQKGAKRHESQWKPEHSLSRRQLETFPDIAARFLQYSKFLARYSSVPAAGKYRKSRTHWTCVVQPGHRLPPMTTEPSGLQG